MGAGTSTCCALGAHGEEHRVEEWKSCSAFDECVLSNDGLREEWKMSSSFGDCIECPEKREAWAPMPVAAMKALDTDRIDPWTREVIENDSCRIIGTMMGVSPTQAPSGYLAQSAGREVIMSDGKDGHMLLSTEIGTTPKEENRARAASQSPKMRVGSATRLRPWSAGPKTRATPRGAASQRWGINDLAELSPKLSGRRTDATRGGQRRAPPYHGRPASAPYSPCVPRAAFGAREQESDTAEQNAGQQGSSSSPGSNAQAEALEDNKEDLDAGLLEGPEPGKVAGARWNDRPIPLAVARAAAGAVAAEELVQETPTLGRPIMASRRVVEPERDSGDEEDRPLRAAFQAPGMPLLEREENTKTKGTAIAQRCSDGL